MKVEQYERKKSIEVVDNGNLARKSIVTMQIVATEPNLDEIVVVGCYKIDSPACQLGCMKA
jgi:hypothetical protein